MKFKKVISALLSVALVMTSIPFVIWSSAEGVDDLDNGKLIGTVDMSDKAADEFGDVKLTVNINTNGQSISAWAYTVTVDPTVLLPLNEDEEGFPYDSLPAYSETAKTINSLGLIAEAPRFSGTRTFNIGDGSALKQTTDGRYIYYLFGYYAAGAAVADKDVATAYFAFAPGKTQDDITEDTIKISDVMIASKTETMEFLSKVDASSHIPATIELNYSEGVITEKELTGPAALENGKLIGTVQESETDDFGDVKLTVNINTNEQSISAWAYTVTVDPAVLLPLNEDEEGFPYDSLPAYSETAKTINSLGLIAEAPRFSGTRTFNIGDGSALKQTTDGRYIYYLFGYYAAGAAVADKDVAIAYFAFAPGKSVEDITEDTIKISDVMIASKTETMEFLSKVDASSHIPKTIELNYDLGEPVNKYDITFTYRDETGTLQTQTNSYDEGTLPTAPEVPATYTVNDVKYTFVKWSPDITAATQNASYVAVYNDGEFIPADYSEYDQVVADANAALAKTDVYTADSLAALESAVESNTVARDLGKSHQSEIDAAKQAIQDAINALVPIKYYTITFTYETAGGITSVPLTVAEGVVPTAPVVPGYSTEDYDYTFDKWSPEIVAASANAEYTAVFTKSALKEADYTAYNTAVAKANQAVADDIYTEATLTALTAAVTANTVETGLGKSQQSLVDTAAAAISAAVDALEKQYYTITFSYKNADGTDVTDPAQTILRHSAPTVPTSIPNYVDGAYTMIFTGWNPAVSYDAVADASYTALYRDSENAADFTKYNAAVAAANQAIATGDYEDDAAMSALEILLAEDVSDWGAAKQSELDKLADDITAATAALVLKKFTVTFSVKGDETKQTVTIHTSAKDIAPVVTDYTVDDTEYKFLGWSPELSEDITASVTYIAVFDAGTFKSADYVAYNAAVAGARAALNSGVVYTDDSVAAVEEALALDVSGLGASKQAIVDAAAAAIDEAVRNLVELTYTITFVYHDDNTIDVVVKPGEVAVVPDEAMASYSDGDFSYTYKGTTVEIVPAAADATYYVEYNKERIPVDLDKYNAAVSAANQAIATGDYTDESVAELQALIDIDISDWGATKQADIDKLAEDIKAATEALVIKKFVVTFSVKGDETKQTVVIHTSAKDIAPAVTDYSEGDYDYTFTGWSPELSDDIVADVTYTAQFEKSEMKLADYSAYNSAVDAAQAILDTASSYTNASVEAVTSALADNTVAAGLGRTQQSVVDAAAAAIKAAVDSAEKLADKSELQALYDDSVAVITPVIDKYTNSTAAAYTAAMEAAKAVLDREVGEKSQQDVDDALTVLTAAISGLKVKADLTELEQTLRTAKAQPTDGYTTASVNALAGAIETAQEVLDKGSDEASQEEADAAVTALRDAIEGLTVDKAELEAAIAVAEATSTDGYTKETVEALEQALEAAKRIDADNNATVADVANATQVLKEALAALKVDKSALQSLVNVANDTDVTGKTPATVETLTGAITAAQAVLDDPGATVSDVVNAYAVLDEALKGLKDVGDKTALQAEYDLDKDLDTAPYTDSTVKKFNNALTAAKKVLDDVNAVQDEIDTALENLIAAKKGLKLRPAVADLDWSEWNRYVELFNAMKESGSYVATDISEIQIFIDGVIASDVSSQSKLDTYTATLKQMILSARLLKADSHTYKSSKEDGKSTSSSSKTGDNASLIVMGGIFASALGLAVISFKRKRDEE